jgi:aspartate racemase
MKKIGLIGGTSWTSTIDYYRYLNEAVNARLGGLHSATCLIYSVDFADFCEANARHDWPATAAILSNAALSLKAAGAELLMLGANTAHIVAEEVQAAASLPLIDIRVATAKAVQEYNLKTVGLLGTIYTMELDFYKNKLAEFNLQILTPKHQSERDFMEETLQHELGKGIIRKETKTEYLQIAQSLIDRGAEGIILGCTEIPLLLTQEDFNLPVFNTTKIHAEAAVEYALTA